MNSDAFKDRLEEIIGGESVRSFAKNSNVSDGAIRQYLKGKNQPGRKKLILIADYKNVNVEWLATGRGPKERGVQKSLGIKDGNALYGRVEDQESEPFGMAVNSLREIFDSKDEILISAIMANLHSFRRAVRREKENQDLKRKINDLEGRLAALEDKISMGDPHGGPPEDPATASPLKNGTTGT